MKSLIPIAAGVGAAYAWQDGTTAQRVALGVGVGYAVSKLLGPRMLGTLPPILDPLPSPPIHLGPPTLTPLPPILDPLPPILDPLPPILDPLPGPPIDLPPPIMQPLPPILDPLPGPPIPTKVPECEKAYEAVRDLLFHSKGTTVPATAAYQYLVAHPGAVSSCKSATSVYNLYYLKTIHDFYEKAFVYKGNQWDAFSTLWTNATQEEPQLVKEAERGIAQAFIDADFINLFEGPSVAKWRDTLWSLAGEDPKSECFYFRKTSPGDIAATYAVAYPTDTQEQCGKSGACYDMMQATGGKCLWGNYKDTFAQ